MSISSGSSSDVSSALIAKPVGSSRGVNYSHIQSSPPPPSSSSSAAVAAMQALGHVAAYSHFVPPPHGSMSITDAALSTPGGTSGGAGSGASSAGGGIGAGLLVSLPVHTPGGFDHSLGLAAGERSVRSGGGGGGGLVMVDDEFTDFMDEERKCCPCMPCHSCACGRCLSHCCQLQN